MRKTDAPITNLEDVLADAGEQTIEIPGWAMDKPFVVRLRRVSLTQLAASGKVPNHLLGAITELYRQNTVSSGNIKILGETMLCIAGACLVEPTLEAIQAKGLELTDLQLTQIYSFATKGVDALRPFRPQQGVSAAVSDRADVAAAAQRAAGDI